MSQRSQQLLEFGPFRIDPVERVLLRAGHAVSLTPKAFETLLALVENPGHIMEKDELLKRVWPDTFVEEATLAKNISTLRHTLGDMGDAPLYIETVPKRGYRFVGEVVLVAAQTGAASGPQPRSVGPMWTAGAKIGFGALVLLILIGGYAWRERSRPAPAVVSKRILLAVLPFRNMTGDAENEYLAEGLTEDMISRLGRLAPERLAVIARTTSMQYKQTKQSAAEIGRTLNVDYVVEGSMRREGQRVRINAQLIRAQDQTQVWAENYDRDLQQILPLQQEVAGAIAQQIHVWLTPGEQPRTTATAHDRPVQPEAHQHYLKGRYFWNKRSEEGFRKAIESFEKAIALDTSYALAYAGLADCYNLLNEYSIRPSAEAFPKAKVAARRALELDESLAEAHASLGYALFYYDWNWPAAEKEFLRAIELNPNYPTAYQWYGEFLVARGRAAESTTQMKKAYQLDPLSLVTQSALAFSYYYGRQPDQAIAQYQKVLEMDPRFAIAHYGMGWAFEQKGDFLRAQQEFLEAIKLLGPDTDAIAAVGYVAARQGTRHAALAVVKRLQELGGRQYVSPVNIAIIYSALGENAEAFAWLEKAHSERYGWLVFANVDPRLDPLRKDPQFQNLLKRIGPAS